MTKKIKATKSNPDRSPIGASLAGVAAKKEARQGNLLAVKKNKKKGCQ